MSDEEIRHPVDADGELDNPLRAIIVFQKEGETSGDMEERLLDSVQSFEAMNSFFDQFDETIAIPNEDHIKYEVGSDGLVVVIVDSQQLLDKTLKFFDSYSTDGSGENTDGVEESEEDTPKKRRR